MKTKLIMCFMAMTLSLTSLSYGQPSRPASKSVQQRFKKKRKKLLRKRLGLNENKARQVEGILDKHQAEHRRLGRQLQQARRQIGKLLRQDSDDQKAFAAALSKMQSAAQEIQKLRYRQFEALKKVLSPKEQAKLLRMLNRVHRKLRERRRKHAKRRGRQRRQRGDRPLGRRPRR